MFLVRERTVESNRILKSCGMETAMNDVDDDETQPSHSAFVDDDKHLS